MPYNLEKLIEWGMGQVSSLLLTWVSSKKSSKEMEEMITALKKELNVKFNKLGKDIKETTETLEKEIKEIKETLEKGLEKIVEPTLQSESPERRTQINNEIRTFSSGFGYIATGIIKIGGLAQTSYMPFDPPMTKSVITEDRRSLPDGTEDLYKK